MASALAVRARGVIRTVELVEQSAERDLVVTRAGVLGGEPGGVLVDLVETPLEVEELEHLGVGSHDIRPRAVVDQDAEVDLGRGEPEGVPVDQEPPVVGQQLVVRVGLAVRRDPGSGPGHVGELVVPLRPAGDVVQTTASGLTPGNR